MAWRFDQAVIRGELDNTEQGHVQVRLELVGHDEPLLLDLEGDAWRDIAGSRFHFSNPHPKLQSRIPPFHGVQKGVVGDITASRKVKVFTVPEEEWRQAYQEDRISEVPTEMRNSLYLEWFTPEHGRCIIESADFEIEVTEHAWQMDEDDEAAQRMASMHAMREYLADIIQRPSREDDGEYDDELRQEDFTEEKWEEQLKASDRLNDASMEAHDKYEEDEDSEEKIAYVMGWDHIIEDMADAQEGVEPSEDDPPEKKRRRRWIEMMNEISNDLQEGEEQAESEGDDDASSEAMHEDPFAGSASETEHAVSDEFDALDKHPLNVQSRKFLHTLFDQLRTPGLSQARGNDPDDPLDRFITHVLQISGKLASATSMACRRPSEGIDIETGHSLALTKRCLNWANEALICLNQLCECPDLKAHHPLFDEWQKELFSLRDGITDFRRDLRQK
ncbi:hypothetical protein [Brevifollis gellanilyticus]|uniref:Uncharacterized protein n=1 Tax=Brevifollis gellanilyticus TaxID=748831 RepID=A0A512ME05_9BACT|nr:hypothetical protein [Brevifollis gellanilyticus]GEP44969.1 hypothetical protein BGE01nite_42600 [Brevifollis gellanilyticus]